MQEMYFSIDIEADGPIPFEYSMLSFGAAAFTDEGGNRPIASWSVNLELLPGAKQDLGTMEWWNKQGKAIWDAARENPRPPEAAMKAFTRWVTATAGEHNAKPVAVCYPVGFDWVFMYPYMVKFAGESPFGFSCLDLKSYVMALLDLKYRETVKRHMPQEWFAGLPPHTHRAVDDAIEQGALFMNVRKWANERRAAGATP